MRLFTLLVVVLLLPGQGMGQTPQGRFEEANAFAEEGDYAAAYRVYQSLEAEGYESGELYYNMGVSAYHLDSLSVAKYFQMKASKFAGTRPQALENISYLNSRFAQRAAELPPLPWEQFFDSLLRNLGLPLLFGFVVGGFNLAVLFYMLGWKIGRPRWLRAVYLALFLGSAALLAVTLYIDYREGRYTDAVMIEDQAAVKEEPSPSAAVVSQAYEGFSFTVDKHSSQDHPGWYYVRMSNGLYGWLPMETIRLL